MGSTSTAANKHHHQPPPAGALLSARPPAKRGVGGAGGFAGVGVDSPPFPELSLPPLPSMDLNPRNPPEPLNHTRNRENPGIDVNGHCNHAATAAAPSSSSAAAAPVAPLLLDGAEEDDALRRSMFLTVEEVIVRRRRRVNQLLRVYKDAHWALLEQLRMRLRDYYWKYGKAPLEEEDDWDDGLGLENGGGGYDGGFPVAATGERSEGTGRGPGVGVLEGESGRNRKRKTATIEYQSCAFTGCNTKAMALTNYCHQHILSDPRQTLYRPCCHVIKSSPSRPISCGKPVLRAAVPPLCTVHFQKGQRHVLQALKKAGANMASSSKLAPKFHVIVAEFVHQIQTKRKEARRAGPENAVDKDKNIG